jgi:hypothetical protein
MPIIVEAVFDIRQSKGVDAVQSKVAGEVFCPYPGKKVFSAVHSSGAASNAITTLANNCHFDIHF